MKPIQHLGLRAAATFAAAFGASTLGVAAPVSAQDVAVLTDFTPNTQPGQGWVANEDDFLFLQLVIKNYKLTYDVRGYRTDRGVCLDLADVVQSLDLPIRLDKKSRRATGWLFAEDQKITIDRDSDTVQNVNTGRAPVNDDIYDTPEGWCVDSQALSRWFGVDFAPDLFNSVVRLESDVELPFMQAIERRNRATRLGRKRQSFDLTKFPHAEMEYKAWRTPSVDVVADAGYRSGSGLTRETSAQVELYVAGEALGASYFARLATNEDLEPNSLRLRAYRYDPDGNLLGPLQATQVAVGDVETLSGQLTGQSGVGRGAFVSNQPLGRTSRFSTTTLRGVLPAGWDAELYRNGQLIGFQEDDGNGRYEFIDVDLFYGRNELEVILYGPQGQIRRERADYPVGLNNIEPGQTYYWAGLLQDQRDLIEIDRSENFGPQKLRWGFGVEHGLDKRTSAALGVHSLFFGAERRRYIEGALTRSFGAMQLEWAAAHEFGSGAITELNALGRVGSINIGANALWTFGNFRSEFVEFNLDNRFGLQFDTSLRLGRVSVPVQAAVQRSQLRDGTDVTEFLTTASFNTGPVALSAQLEHQEQNGGEDLPDQSQTRLNLLASTRIKGLRLRGNATFELVGEDSGFDSAEISVERRIGDRSRLAAEVQYLAETNNTRFQLGFSRRFDSFALRGDAGIDTDGAVNANLSLAFSIGPDPARGGVRFSESKLARTGQAAVTVFRDDNGDGRFNEGEQVLKDVGVEAGFRSSGAVTSDDGQAILENLRPYRAVLVGIDEASLSDPYLAPSTKGVVVVPRPGVAARIELAITASGEVEGSLLGLNGLEQAGVALELIDTAGNAIATTTSEYDGFFLFERVPYGQYSLQIASEDARKLQVAAQLAPGLTISSEEDIVRVGVIKLKSDTPVIASNTADALVGNPAVAPSIKPAQPLITAEAKDETGADPPAEVASLVRSEFNLQTYGPPAR